MPSPLAFGERQVVRVMHDTQRLRVSCAPADACATTCRRQRRKRPVQGACDMARRSARRRRSLLQLFDLGARDRRRRRGPSGTHRAGSMFSITIWLVPKLSMPFSSRPSRTVLTNSSLLSVFMLRAATADQTFLVGAVTAVARRRAPGAKAVHRLGVDLVAVDDFVKRSRLRGCCRLLGGCLAAGGRGDQECNAQQRSPKHRRVHPYLKKGDRSLDSAHPPW